MSAVAPDGTLRNAIDTLNDLLSRLSSGVIELGPGDQSILEDAAIGPASVVILVPRSAGANQSGIQVVNGLGQATLVHSPSQENQQFTYFVYTGEPS